MIDPMGPDPTDPATPARQVREIVSELEFPEPPSLMRPKVRYADYDRPDASAKPAWDATQAKPQAPAAKPAPAPAPSRGPVPAPAPTALARTPRQPEKPSRFERAIGVARTVLPLVGKMLPLLEGNVVSAASNLLAPRPVEVNLKPLEEAISGLQADQRALTFHTSEQKRALRRLEDEFASLQESVQKSAEQQAELTEHVAKLARRTSRFMRLVGILLLVSILFTALLCVRIAYIIRF
jgi:hypothetical protein